MIAARFCDPVKDDLGAHKLRTPEEVEAALDCMMQERGEGDLWLFGYGSQMWKPELDFAEARPALLNGWHRRFCLWQLRYRGSRAHPGLMLALDRGGSCRGVAYRIAAPGVRDKVTAVWKREMTGNGYVPRWVKLTTMQGPVRGLTLSANGAYTKAKLKDDTPPATGGLAGDPLPWVPKWSGAISADYEFPLGGVEGFVGGTVNYVGKRVANLDERTADDRPIRIPSYTEVDLRAGVNLDHWTIEAFARNLFNKRGITDAFGFDGATFPNGAAGVAVIRPRTFGLVVTARY